MMDYNEVIRKIRGLPTAMTRRSTVQVAPVLVPDEEETYVIETVWTDGGSYILLQHIDNEGTAYRVAIPPKAVAVIYRQRDSIVDKRRSAAAKKGAETRAGRGVIPFERRATGEA